MKRIATGLAIALVFVSALCNTSRAQTAPAGTGSPEKTYALLPGLDKRLIDTTADPCVDFFKYACGNFSKLYPIPNDRSSFGTGAMIATTIPGEWRGAEHDRIRPGFRLQSRAADDAGQRLSGVARNGCRFPALRPSKERRDKDGAPAVVINKMERRASPPVFIYRRR